MVGFAQFAGRFVKAFAFVALVGGSLVTPEARAQAPYLLPYTIQTLAGGGTPLAAAPSPSAPCQGPGATGVTYDQYGDGCQITSTSVVLGAGTTSTNAQGVTTQAPGNVHDVAVDQQGNIYFIDESLSSASTDGVVRRIDARSGIVTIYVGSYLGASPCLSSTYATLADKYGDGCPANDGKANASGGYTDPATARGLAVAKNGDLYIAGYQDNLIHKVSVATGLMSYVAGYVTGTVGTSTSHSNTSTAGFTGNGGPATSAEIKNPRGVGVDNAGNIYIADTGNNVVQEVMASTGIINIIAGSPSGTAGVTGDGGPATSALVSAPEGVVVDASGNVFIADQGNNKVRVIYAGGAAVAKLIALTNSGTVAIPGYIYTIMGGGAGTYGAGVYILGTGAAVAGVRKLAVDSRDNVYLADNTNEVVDFLDASTGFMHVIAGTYQVPATGGTTLPVTSKGAGCAQATDSIGDNCPAVDGLLFSYASSNGGDGVALDGSGNLYISDSGNDRLRKVTTNQTFPATTTGTSVTQTLDVHYSLGDTAAALTPFTISGSTDFTLGSPSCTVNADTTQDCLVPVTFKPSVAGEESADLVVNSTLNGTSVFSLSGSGVAATVAFDPGAVTSFVASGTVKAATAITQDSAGNTYVADTGNNRVLRYTPSGTQTIVAGSGTSGYSGDGGSATAAKLAGPSGVTVAPSGTIYIADTGNNVVRSVNPATGLIATVAGGASTACSAPTDSFGDGCPATAAKLSKPAGVASDSLGNIYIADTGDNLIRELTVSGYIFTVGGGASAVCTASGADSIGNGCSPLQATFNGPTALAVDTSNNIYVADTGNNEVRELVASSAQVALLAGSAGIAGSGGNNGPANAAQLNAPTGLAVDAAGNVYIADTGNDAVRVVNSAKTITTVVGTVATSGTGTVPGAATGVLLNAPLGVASNGAGNLEILDSGNNRVLTDSRGSVSYNFGRTNVGFSSPAVTITETSTGSAAATLGTLFSTSGSPNVFTLTASGTTGCTSAQNLGIGGSCLLTAQFTPTASTLGAFTATYTEAGTNTIDSPAPFIALSGTGAVLTQTTETVALTTPAVTPQYAIPFSVTATIAAASCNTAAPACYPTGTATFYVDGTSVGTSTLSAGATPASTSATATFSIASPLNVGAHKVTVVYGGDSYYASGTSAVLTVTIVTEATTSSVTAAPNPVPQLSNLVLTATVTATSGNPTGTFSFYAGTTLLGTAQITGKTGVATLSDVLGTVNGGTHYPNSFGLAVGTYCVTAQYSGDSNYSASTSPCTTLVISADAQTFGISLSATSTGAQQGSTGQVTLTVTPSNTLSGTVKFSCSGSPTSSDCTFTPTTLTFIPSPLVANGQISSLAQTTTVALWTNIPPGAATPASLWGWPLLLLSTAGILGFRRKGRLSLVAVLAVFGMLVGSSVGLTACSSPVSGLPTPLGTYTIVINASGPSGTTPQTASLQFTVTAGNPGGE